MSKDQSFAKITGKFQRNIYDTSKGKLRLAVLQADLEPFIERCDSSMRILDIGAGTGQVSAWFAAQGAQVTHTDIAAEMVIAAQELHQQLGLADQYQYHTAALQSLPEVLAQDDGELPTFDLILCHAVLEWLDDPQAAIAVLKSFMTAESVLSLMFYNRNAKLFANVVYGNFDYVQSDLQVKKTVRLSPQQPIAPEAMNVWLSDAGLSVEARSGVRCFHDYLRRPELHRDAVELQELELQYRRVSPFMELGRYQHWLIRKQ